MTLVKPMFVIVLFDTFYVLTCATDLCIVVFECFSLITILDMNVLYDSCKSTSPSNSGSLLSSFYGTTLAILPPNFVPPLDPPFAPLFAPSIALFLSCIALASNPLFLVAFESVCGSIEE